jgi:hypothetical protein
LNANSAIVERLDAAPRDAPPEVDGARARFDRLWASYNGKQRDADLILMEIRDTKAYLAVWPTWDLFCERQLFR